ncbi:MAG: SDR family NAD(P)-dependent oxidoreductase [Aestuariivita sp.]|nr:SDR family NAD(P)-dependent oxidoreductase [Aestuariivita sp.]MCY4345900.1 SDR family NAD(P)-dependent oxidoreductase [Aestuariivita sp.]
MENAQSLRGKVAVVTGAGRGIGRSIALAFAGAGADIAICSRTAGELAKVKKVATAHGVNCHAEVVDLSDQDTTQAWCAAILRTFTKVDILVNNAGAELEIRAIAESDPDSWWKTIEINVRGPYMVTRFLLDGFADGGKIINVTSGMGKRAGIDNSAYHISKAAMNMFTGALANELWVRKITANNLIPGPVATGMLNRDAITGQKSTPDGILAKFSENPPERFPPWERLKHPDEVGQFALYMASFPVDGPNGQDFSLARRPLD